ncbi:MAG: RluA family pseudouridine synthase [Planctomycetes bacterium]|nr:RluA family pseudouridine synthase [Planctomycetota bacterium]
MAKRSPHYRSFAVAFEDDHLIVVSKPGGLLTNMAESGEQTLQDQVRRHAKKSAEPDAVAPSAVHRLDRFTSGLVVFGKTQRALEAMGELLRDGKLEKRYWVLVCGADLPKTGRIEAALERTESGKRKMQVSEAEHAQPAQTEYETEETIGDFALLSVRIHTGRTHQIRVHCAHIGHPVAGDNIYGDRKVNAELRRQHGLQRQFIHARELAFAHPITGETLRLQAKLPKDLSRVLKSLRAK